MANVRLIQDKWTIKVSSDLGKDALLFRRMEGFEELGGLTEFQVDLYGQGDLVKLQDILGKLIKIEMDILDHGLQTVKAKRYFNGYVTDFTYVSEHTSAAFKVTHYKVVLRPWFWFLTRSDQSRIFQDKTVNEIITEVISDERYKSVVNAKTFDIKSLDTYPSLPYCVQYKESDFNFLSRLMQQFGIYYYFKYDADAHTLVFADSYTAHSEIPKYEKIEVRSGNLWNPFQSSFSTTIQKPSQLSSSVAAIDASFPLVDKSQTSSLNYLIPDNQYSERIYEWQPQGSIQPGTYTLKDFNFELMSTATLDGGISKSQSPSLGFHDHDHYEIFDYPGAYVFSEKLGDLLASIRMQALHVQQQKIIGRTDARGLAIGGLFQITNNSPRSDKTSDPNKYLVISTKFVIDFAPDRSQTWSQDSFLENWNNDFFSARRKKLQSFFNCEFRVISNENIYRSPQVTLKPVMQGPQTALVIAPDGEEVNTDQYGRVKVRFFWDISKKPKDTDSGWIRVAQTFAHKRWGSIFIPRKDQEVIVQFLEGDPDRPYITGSLYNATNKPPYDLPANKTRSTIKTNSTIGGQGYNEIRFEDKKDSEQLFIRAQKNFAKFVKETLSEWVTKDRHLFIETGNQLEQVAQDKHQSIGGMQILKIIKGFFVKAEKIAQKTDTTFHLHAGTDFHVKAGGKINIQAETQISLSVGGSFVVIDSSGVSIKGGAIKLNSGGSSDSADAAPTQDPTPPPVKDFIAEEDRK